MGVLWVVYRWGLATAAEPSATDAAAAADSSAADLNTEEAKRLRAKARSEAREARRTKLLSLLFDEFDVTEQAEGVGADAGRWQYCEERPANGRQVVSEQLSEALSKRKGKTRLVSTVEADAFVVSAAADGAKLGGVAHGDFVAGGGGGYFQLRAKDDQLNRDEFRELVRLGRMRMIFNAMDADSSGQVDKRELASKLQADNELEEQLGVKGTSGVGVYGSYIYVFLAHQFDTAPKDGQLSRSEFEAMLTTATTKAQEEATKQAAVADAASVPLA